MYDRDYLREYQRRATTDIGQKIMAGRWSLVRQFVEGGRLLDYGCGTGVFHSCGNGTFATFGFDVNPDSDYFVMPQGPWDVVTFWDVLEHIPDPWGTVESLDAEWLFIAFPDIKTVPLEQIHEWKHYKPHEHLHYFTIEGLTASLHNYQLIHVDNEEGKIRNPDNPEWITTAVYRKLT